jgi:hypothetical protein
MIYGHSLADIAAGKLLARFGRAEERDFIDVYFIVKAAPSRWIV